MACADDDLRPLDPAEERLVQAATPKRVMDFRLGRHCAHAALRTLGISVPALLRDEDRAPAWPTGIVGSITHGAGMGAAVVALDKAVRGLGIDVERARNALPRGVWRLVFTAEEEAFLSGLSDEAAERTAHVWFSLKESAFKAAHGAWRIGPPLRRIALEPGTWSFPDPFGGTGATLRLDDGRVLSGCWLSDGARVVSSAVVPAPSTDGSSSPSCGLER